MQQNKKSSKMLLVIFVLMGMLTINQQNGVECFKLEPVGQNQISNSEEQYHKFARVSRFNFIKIITLIF